MKQAKYIFAAALAMLALGCNKEQVTEAVPDGSEVGVTFTAELPGMQTKAIGDGLTAKNLTVEVYEDEDGVAGTNIEALHQTATFTALKTDVKFNLVKGKTYHFIFWAQADNAPYTLAAAAKTVAISYAGEANDESRDAFYAVKTLKVQGPATEQVQLKRPFAQVNFGTADFAEAKAGGVEVTKSSFTATDAATSLDLFAGEGVGSTDITYTEKELPTEALTLKDGTTYTYMAMNYFVPTGKFAESHVSNVKAQFVSASHTVEISSPSTPVQSNWRTNIVGNLLTDQVVFNVEIVPAFEDEENINLTNISTLNELKTLFAVGGSATLMADITVPESVILKGNKIVNLNLGGKTLTYAGTQNALFRVEEGTLVIDGDGSIIGGGDEANERVMFLAKGAESHLIIRNGSFKIGKCTASEHDWYDCVYALNDGKIDIYGGTFETEATRPNGKRYIINVNNQNPGVVNVYGGKFIGYDPKTGDDYLGGNFLASGYRTVKNGDIYEVVAATVVGTAAELDQAIENASADDVIYLKAGTYNNVIDIRSSKTISFKPVAGATVVLAGVNCSSNNTTACTFEDITFDNSLQTTGWFTGTAPNINPCVGAWGGKLNFKNCKFIVDGNSAKETGVMTWWTLETCPVTLSFNGCTFEGKNNHAEARAMQIYGHVDLTVDGCTLTTAKRYAIKYVGNESFTATFRNNQVSNCEYTVELGSAVYPGSKYIVNFENNTLAPGIADYKIAHAEDATINGGTAK